MLGFIFNWRVWAVVFVAYFLYTAPGAAAAKVHQGLGVASNAGHALAVFVNRL
jgi:hypothetical protein